MLQLIAAIPTIFNAIGKVSQLFGKGKETVEQVTGKPSEASTPEELRTEIESLPVDEKNRWAEIMSKEVDLYAKQNERLATEIGLIDSNITGKLDTKSANEIAVLRMTTRPWTVRLMVHYVLFPFYLVFLDVIQNLVLSWFPILKSWFGVKAFNSFEYVFGVMEVPEEVFENADEKASAMQTLLQVFSEHGAAPTTFAGELYMESIPWVVSIIIGYMGLREVGKARGHKDPEAPGASATGSVSVAGKGLASGLPLINSVRQWLKGKL